MTLHELAEADLIARRLEHELLNHDDTGTCDCADGSDLDLVPIEVAIRRAS